MMDKLCLQVKLEKLMEEVQDERMEKNSVAEIYHLVLALHYQKELVKSCVHLKKSV